MLIVAYNQLVSFDVLFAVPVDLTDVPANIGNMNVAYIPLLEHLALDSS
jgi:hypothetical protein